MDPLHLPRLHEAEEDLALYFSDKPQLNPTPAQIRKIARTVLESYLPAAQVELCRHVWIYHPTPKSLGGPRVYCTYCGRVDNSRRDIVNQSQLRELEDGEAVVDYNGTLWQKLDGKWYRPGSKHGWHPRMVERPAQRVELPEVKS